MSQSIGSREPAVDLSQMLSQFYAPGEEQRLGVFRSADGEQMPSPFGQLLDHHSHMTVTVESHYQTQVDVRLVQTTKDATWYSREILLTSRATGSIVQYGIVRLRYGVLAPPVWHEIEAGLKPLGRVLIEHDVLRQVELVGLWKVECGPVLGEYFKVLPGTITYGRTARIFCDAEPAIELLEIVRPD